MTIAGYHEEPQGPAPGSFVRRHAAILQRREVAINTYEHSESVERVAGPVEDATFGLLKEYQGNIALRKQGLTTANSDLDAAREICHVLS